MLNFFKKNDNTAPQKPLPLTSSDRARLDNEVTKPAKMLGDGFYEFISTIQVSAFPLEFDTDPRPVAEVAHQLLSELHRCLEAKIRLGVASEIFLQSDAFRRFRISFADGFIFDELEAFASLSDEQLKWQAESNYAAYYLAYVLGLIGELPKNPEGCNEERLCELIVSYESYAKLLEACEPLDKEQQLCIADRLYMEVLYDYYSKTNNLSFDAKMAHYRNVQCACAKYALQFELPKA